MAHARPYHRLQSVLSHLHVPSVSTCRHISSSIHSDHSSDNTSTTEILSQVPIASLDETAKRVALIIGAGDATGAAACRAFARQGYVVVAVRRDKGASVGNLDALIDSLRSDGLHAHGFAIDARREDQVIALLEKIESDIGQMQICLHNIGPNVFRGILDTDVQLYFKMWEMCAGSAHIVGREVARRMLARGAGCIFFTGASASMRGNPGFAAFAGAMAAKRMLAQSMSRELAPHGIHVAHVIIDGIIDTGFHASDASPVPRDRYRVLKEGDGLVSPDGIAESLVQLAHQRRSAWTFELDLRPWTEKW